MQIHFICQADNESEPRQARRNEVCGEQKNKQTNKNYIKLKEETKFTKAADVVWNRDLQPVALGLRAAQQSLIWSFDQK